MPSVRVLVVVLALAAAAPTSASDGGPCRADIERLCARVEPGGGRRVACLRSQLENVSPDCRTRMAQVQRSLRGIEPRMVLACKADIETLCKGVVQGNGRWRRCLDDHAANLSAPCRQLVDRAVQ